MERVAAVVEHLDTRGVRSALIGGLALAAHGISRATQDADLLVVEPAVLGQDFWRDWPGEAETRRGEPSDPLAGVVRCHRADWAGSQVDVVVGKYRWMVGVLERRREVTVEGVRLPIVTAPDLILLKLFAGGPQDLLDVELLVAASPSCVQEVRQRLADLPEEARKAWPFGA